MGIPTLPSDDYMIMSRTEFDHLSANSWKSDSTNPFDSKASDEDVNPAVDMIHWKTKAERKAHEDQKKLMEKEIKKLEEEIPHNLEFLVTDFIMKELKNEDIQEEQEKKSKMVSSERHQVRNVDEFSEFEKAQFELQLEQLRAVSRTQMHDDATQMFLKADQHLAGKLKQSEIGSMLHHLHDDKLFIFNWDSVDDQYLRAYIHYFEWRNESYFDIIEFTNFYSHAIENLIETLEDLVDHPYEYGHSK